jgi:site-specific recombinase XerD
MDGLDERGKRVLRSLRTRSWPHAQERLAEIERGEQPKEQPDRKGARRLDTSIQSFLEDCRARKLAPSTIVSYENTLGHLSNFFPGAHIATITLDRLTRFRAERASAAARSSGKELQTIRSFFRFAVVRKWIPENPAIHLKVPKPDLLPTMPFTQEEIEAILEACDRINNPNQPERARLRARALVLLLLYSGLRISDAVQLPRSKVDFKTGRILIRIMKTRVPLYVRIPQAAVNALQALPLESLYFFWSGRSKLSTAVGSARRTIECLMKLTGIEGHPHRFRDTFSVGLLEAGAELRTVQLLLGHTSIRTTEKHYAPFVASMQAALDSAVSKLHFESDGGDAPLAVEISKIIDDGSGTAGVSRKPCSTPDEST